MSDFDQLKAAMDLSAAAVDKLSRGKAKLEQALEMKDQIVARLKRSNMEAIAQITELESMLGAHLLRERRLAKQVEEKVRREAALMTQVAQQTDIQDELEAELERSMQQLRNSALRDANVPVSDSAELRTLRKEHYALQLELSELQQNQEALESELVSSRSSEEKNTKELVSSLLEALDETVEAVNSSSLSKGSGSYIDLESVGFNLNVQTRSLINTGKRDSTATQTLVLEAREPGSDQVVYKSQLNLSSQVGRGESSFSSSQPVPARFRNCDLKLILLEGVQTVGQVRTSLDKLARRGQLTYTLSNPESPSLNQKLLRARSSMQIRCSATTKRKKQADLGQLHGKFQRFNVGLQALLKSHQM